MLTTIEGKARITNIEEIENSSVVYNIHVNGYNDYYAEGVLVHNKADEANLKKLFGPKSLEPLTKSDIDSAFERTALTVGEEGALLNLESKLRKANGNPQLMTSLIQDFIKSYPEVAEKLLTRTAYETYNYVMPDLLKVYGIRSEPFEIAISLISDFLNPLNIQNKLVPQIQDILASNPEANAFSRYLRGYSPADIKKVASAHFSEAVQKYQNLIALFKSWGIGSADDLGRVRFDESKYELLSSGEKAIFNAFKKDYGDIDAVSQQFFRFN